MDNSEKKILVVEDEPALKEMLVFLFEDEGYQVKSAANGEEAWELLCNDTFDLVATDMFMPKMSGLELIRKCQNNFPSIKTILFSGGGRGIEAQHGSRSVHYQDQSIETDAFMKKPFNVDELLQTVRGLLKT